MKKDNPADPQILVIHGPNLNLLGRREPEIYGHAMLSEINSSLTILAEKAGVILEAFQSNSEGELIDRVQRAIDERIHFIIINPAAFTHTSIALRDALAAAHIPFLEVHLSNIFAREAFRKKSYFSDLAVGVVSGLGTQSYELALQYALTRIHAQS